MLTIHPAILRSGDAAALQAAEALVKALTTPIWPENRLKPNGKMTQRTLAALRTYAAIPEVRNYLADLSAKGYLVDSRQWHYFKYKYEHSDPLLSPDELDHRFDAVLSDRQAVIYWKTGRFVVYSPREDRLVVISIEGYRISVYRPESEDKAKLGDYTWPINQMID
ncbi:MAG: hypothetical protein QG599_558 [Pseudomonadota bacterium]|nr:hypothetical protein [Pseudomonadota bacterium]